MRTSCLRLATARKRVRGFTETTLRKTKSERKGSRGQGGQGVKGSRRTGEQENRGIGEQGKGRSIRPLLLLPFPFPLCPHSHFPLFPSSSNGQASLNT